MLRMDWIRGEIQRKASPEACKAMVFRVNLLYSHFQETSEMVSFNLIFDALLLLL